MGIAVMVMASIGHVAVAAVGAFGIGFGAIFIIVPTQTLMQQETPVELVGRVSSSFMSVLSVSQLLGLIISGSLTESSGNQESLFRERGDAGSFRGLWICPAADSGESGDSRALDSSVL